MAVAAARTKTKTYPRLTAIYTQARRILRRTTDISESSLDQITYGIKERWIREVSCYAFDEDDLCRGSVEFTIDWSQYDEQLSFGRATITIEERKWKDDTAIEVDECIRSFSEFVSENGLRTEWRVTYSGWVYEDDALLANVRAQLGHKQADPVKWAGSIIGDPFAIPELPEVRVGQYFAE